MNVQTPAHTSPPSDAHRHVLSNASQFNSLHIELKAYHPSTLCSSLTLSLSLLKF